MAIYTNTTVSDIQLSRSGSVESVIITQADGSTTTFSNSDVVISAGAWSQSELNRLFPDNTVEMRPCLRSGNYVVVLAPEPVPIEQQGAISMDVFWDDVGASKFIEAIPRDDGTIWISGLNNFIAPLGEPNDLYEPDAYTKARFLEWARKCLTFDCTDYQVLEWGRVHRPMIERGLTSPYGEPFITQVPIDRLSKNAVAASSTQAGGRVFLAAGHTAHGVKESMATGKLITQLVLGQRPEFPLEQFSLEGAQPAGKE